MAAARRLAALAGLLLAIGLAGPARATDLGSATALVDRLAGKALTVVADTALSLPEKAAAFETLLGEGFDMRSVGRFALGRFWRVASPEQQATYLDLFERMIVAIYTVRLSQFSGETFRIVGGRAEGEGDLIVASEILSPNGAPPLKVDWRLRGDAEPRIIDVAIEGISMLVVLRSEISSVLQNNGGSIDALLAVLRQRSAAIRPS